MRYANSACGSQSGINLSLGYTRLNKPLAAFQQFQNLDQKQYLLGESYSSSNLQQIPPGNLEGLHLRNLIKS